MVIPGYDPEDIDDALESRLEENELRERLTDEEWDAYQHREAALADMLDENEIADLVADDS
jgi:hypothetical protein